MAPLAEFMMDLKIDKIDLKILQTLQRNGRITNQDLAEKVCLSPSSCLQRVRRLEKGQVIQSYHARIDLSRVARHIMCIATVSLKNHTQQEFKAFEAVELNTLRGTPTPATQ